MSLLTKPNRYVLGTTPELDVTPTDVDGNFFTPVLVRLSVKEPSGTITTYSGGDLTQGSGYLFAVYRPLTIGYYAYESWVRDGAGREKTVTSAFEIYDEVY